MKTIIYKTLSAASITLLFISCKPQIDVPVADKGSLDVSKYVAIGNSMTAGYTDNALYRGGQQVAYPNLLAEQFKLIGGGDFNQPLVGANSVGIGSSLNARLALAPMANCKGAISLAPTYIAGNGDLSIFGSSVAAEGPFNNLGVAGLKATTAIYPGYGNPDNGPGNFNPFFTRMSAQPQTASILSEAMVQNPTFFSVFVGTHEVLNYAISGGASDVITPSAGPAGLGFDASVELLVNTLTAGGAKGVIANVPSITSMPYFTTIPYNGLLLDQANAAALSAAYAPLGISFQQGNNGFIIEDDNAPGGLRKITQGELILLSVPQDSLQCGGWGSMKPIPHQYVLTADEVAQINSATIAYNASLQSLAAAKGLAYVDVNSFMHRMETGIMYNGIGLNASFVAGGAFSLDGIHLTPVGNALLANEFITAINAKYGSTIPKINVTRYKGVVFP